MLFLHRGHANTAVKMAWCTTKKTGSLQRFLEFDLEFAKNVTKTFCLYLNVLLTLYKGRYITNIKIVSRVTSLPLVYYTI